MGISRRPVLVVVAVAVVAASCGGGSSADSATTADPGVAASEDTAASSTNAREQASTTETAATPTNEPVAVPAFDGEFRCERFGYPCTWGEVPDEALARLEGVADEVRSLVAGAPDPVAGVEAALAYLQGNDDVVEVIADTEAFTSVMFRVDGSLPFVVFTDLAAPQGEPFEYTGPDLVETLAPGDAGAVDAVYRPGGVQAVSADFHPVGGPIVQKRAIVLDPFASPSEDCGGGVPDADCYRTPKGRVEGSLIAAIMGSHPQITVDYLAGEDVTPAAVASLGGYDLVHWASHGSNACGGFDWFGNAAFDPNLCYSVVALGPLAQASGTFDVSPPPGVWRGVSSGENFHRWVVTSEYLASVLGPEAIVFGNSCTSGDGGLGRAGAPSRSFVGWHSYARMNGAAETAIEFWTLMVKDGVSFDLAVERLEAEGLHETHAPTWDEWVGILPTGVVHASLVVTGKDQRARDVITAYIGDREITRGITIRTTGTAGDRADDEVDGVRFVVEGVEDGTQDDTVIKVLIDGKELDRRITAGDGTPIDQKEGYAVWEVIVDHLDIGFDLTFDDVDPTDPREFDWEARVYTEASEYSADEAREIHFGALLRAEGEIGLLNAIDADLRRGGGAVLENLLTMQFPSWGGPVAGEFRAVIRGPSQTTASGTWRLQFSGTYDPGTGMITGEAQGQGFDPQTGIFTDEIVTGPLEATVDLAGKTVTGSMAFPYGSPGFLANIIG